MSVEQAADVSPPTEPSARSSELRSAVSVFVALVVIGAVLGVVWAVWSPAGSAARITPAGRLQEESEAWVAADGRFLVLGAAAGLVAALAAWRRVRDRGPAMLLALALGGLAGSALMWLVGWAVGGGSDNGAADGFIAHQRTTIHIHGLLFVQAGVAVLIYGLLVAFATHDDLGRPDADREQRLAAHRGQPAYPPGAAYPQPPYPQPPYPQPPYPPGSGYPAPSYSPEHPSGPQ